MDQPKRRKRLFFGDRYAVFLLMKTILIEAIYYTIHIRKIMNDTFRGLTFRSKIPSINPEILLKTVNLTPESNFKRRKALKKQCFAPFFR